MGGGGQGGDNKDEKDKKVGKQDRINFFMLTLINRRTSPSTSHLHDQQPESAERSASKLAQMHQQSCLPYTLLPDAN
jgi:hypothetical protein